MRASELKAEIEEELGPDLYAPYTTEKYQLPDEVVKALCEVVIIAFLKGFFDFEKLGKGLRARVEARIQSYQRDPKLVKPDLGSMANDALGTADRPDELQAQGAEAAVTKFLVSYGVHPERASRHSRVIAQKIIATLEEEQAR